MHPAEGREEKEQISTNKKEAPGRVLPFLCLREGRLDATALPWHRGDVGIAPYGRLQEMRPCNGRRDEVIPPYGNIHRQPFHKAA